MGMANLRAGPTAGDDMTTGVMVFRYPAHVLEPTAGTMKAYLLDGRLVGVTGKVVGFWDSSSGLAIGTHPASAPPAVVNMGGYIVNQAKGRSTTATPMRT